MFIDSSNEDGRQSMSKYIEQRLLNSRSPSWLWSNRQLKDYCEVPENLWRAKVFDGKIQAFLFYQMNQLSYEVSSNKIKKIGFRCRDDIKRGINDTLKLLEGINNE